MFKKINLSSPIGIALTVTAIVLVLSPEARRKIRRLLVIGTAGIVDTIEQIGGIAQGLSSTEKGTSKSSETSLSSTSTNKDTLSYESGTNLSSDPSN